MSDGVEFVPSVIGSQIDQRPVIEPGVRSLNLANAVSIVLYEALRRTGQLNE